MHEAETESNLLQWGRRLFEGDPPYYTSPGHYDGGVILTPGDGYGDYGAGDDRYDLADSSHVENDEIIARTLQEEFCHLAVVESPPEGGPGVEEEEEEEEGEDRRVAYHAYPSDGGFHHVPAGDYSEREASDDVVPSSSCSSPGGNGEEWSWSQGSGDDEGDFDDEEVRRKLEDMISIPHVPKINGEIPSVDEATTDHERLENGLQVLGFVEFKVQGDGNCQFRALSDQLYGTPDHHRNVRRQIVNQLKLHPEIYDGYVPMEYSDYLRQMSKSGEWGDHVTLQAAADSYDIEIRVVTSYEQNSCIDILPGNQKPKRTIFLSFWAEVHYNSIYPQAGSDNASIALRKKKRWWNFGN